MVDCMKGGDLMLEGSYIHPISNVNASDLLKRWLLVHAAGIDFTPENAGRLADMYPGFVDVSFLVNVWRDLNNETSL